MTQEAQKTDGPDPKQRQLDQSLLQAVREGAVTTVDFLLQQGADPNARDPRTGWPVLHVAVELEQEAILRALVEGGADLDAHARNGFTALHLAVDVEADAAAQMNTAPTSDLTKLVLELGVDPALRDREDRTALALAEGFGHKEAAAAIKAAMGKPRKAREKKKKG